MGSVASGATAIGAYFTKPAEKDPYIYQPGFGNRFASEALSVPLSTINVVARTNVIFQTRRHSIRSEQSPTRQI